MRILIAEDDPDFHDLLAAMLRRAGHEVVSAFDGTEALAAMGSPDAPQMAILDWEMPWLSGTEVCRRLRQPRGTPYVYILMLTSHTDEEHIVEGLQAGADDYLSKPCHVQELHARIRAGERILSLQSGLIASREELRRDATHDGLTHLLNRSATDAVLAREIDRASRQTSSLSAMMIDIDHFKNINDTHGHRGGDEVLCEIARRLQTALRPYDSLGRYGGEEFLVVLPGCDLARAAGIAERMRRRVGATPVELETGAAVVTASFGVAQLELHGTAVDLVSAADRALYRAKNQGRNRVDPDLLSSTG